MKFATVFNTNKPSAVLSYLQRQHNAFHNGSSTNHVEILVEIETIEDGWKVRWGELLKQGTTYSSLPKGGKGS